jgi:hypothetical protein
MRRFLQLFWAALAGVIFVPIFGGFFSKLAEEQGWYEHPTARVETVMNWLFGIAFHPAYLFMAGLVLGLALGMWMDLVLRKREPKTENTPLEWLGPSDAIMKFGKRHLIHNLQAYEGERNALTKMHSSICDQMEKLEEGSEQHAALEVQRQAFWNSFAEVQVRYGDCWEALRYEIEYDLRQGRIIGRGFAEPHTPGKPVMIIPTDEWRFLTLDDEDEKATGSSINYIALQIAKPN